MSVKWEKSESLSCDPVALEKQALGCLSKALAVRHGEQEDTTSSVCLGAEWVNSVGTELHSKLNLTAVLTRHKTGIEFGSSTSMSVGYDIDMEPQYTLDAELIDRKRLSVNSWLGGGG